VYIRNSDCMENIGYTPRDLLLIISIWEKLIL